MRSSGCVEIDRGDELGQRNVDGEVCSLPLAAPRKEKGGTGRDRTGTFEAFARIRAPTPRSGAIADAWSGADEHSRRYGRRAPQCRAGDALFLRLMILARV